VRSEIFRGRGFEQIGVVDVVSEGSLAIGISRGGAPKAYSHVEPNEDAVLCAEGEGGALIAVADGHFGARGAEVCMDLLLASYAPIWTALASPAASADRWLEVALEALVAADRAIKSEASERRASVSPTTLSLCLIRPSDGRLDFASVGDSHLFVSRKGAVSDVGGRNARHPGPNFLGQFKSRDSFAARSSIGSQPLQDVDAVVLATDGLSEVGIGVSDPISIVRQVLVESGKVDPGLQPMTACRSVIEQANQAHRQQRSGDNIAVAVWWRAQDGS
jgi:serine/threonine protein phosphatase PrpC